MPLEWSNPAEQERPKGLQWEDPRSPVQEQTNALPIPPRDSSLAEDMTAGYQRGLDENFTSSMGTVMESYLPLGRLFVNDEDGFHVWKSTPEVLGISQEHWDKLEPSDRRKLISEKSVNILKEKHANADDTSAAYNITRFTGMLTDPSSLLVFNPTSLLGRAAVGSTFGAVDAAAYSAAQEGDVDPKLVGIAAGIGAAIPMAGHLMFSKGTKRKAAEELINSFKTQVAIERESSDNLVQAYMKARKNTDLDYIKLEKAMATVDDTFKGVFGDLVTKQKASQYLESGFKYQSVANKGQFRNTLDRLFEPVGARIKKMSPRVWTKMQEFERTSFERMHEYAMNVDPFINKLRKLRKAAPEEYKILSKALFNSDSNTIFSQISKHGMEDEYKAYRVIMDDLYSLQTRTGRELPYIEQYTPRWVKDWPAMQRILNQEDKGIVQKIIDRERARIGRDLTDDQVSNIYNNYLRGNYDPKKLTLLPRSARNRKIVEVNDEMIDTLSSPEQAIHSYIRDSVEDSYKRLLFGKDIVAKHGDELRGSIGDFVNGLVKQKHLNPKDIDELKLLMELRFTGGKKKPIALIQEFKNYGYAALLGNPVAAITQFGDLAYSVYKNGLRDTVSAVAKTLGRGRRLSPKEMGLLDNIAAEFAAETPSKKFLDKMLSASMFRSVDSLGKSAIINSTISKTTRLSKTMGGVQKLRTKWGPYLGGEEFAKTIQEFQAFARGDIVKPTARMKSVAFMELADIQPVSLLEMPEVYLKNPNLRLFYMLKTFAMKHINLVRQEIAHTWKQGNRVQAIKNMALLYTYFMAAGMSTDMAKALVTNKDPVVEDIAINNIFKFTGLWDRYSLSKMARSGDPATDFVSQTMMPPLGVISPMVRSAMHGAEQLSQGELNIDEWKLEDNVKYIPLVGRILDAWVVKD